MSLNAPLPCRFELEEVTVQVHGVGHHALVGESETVPFSFAYLYGICVGVGTAPL